MFEEEKYRVPFFSMFESGWENVFGRSWELGFVEGMYQGDLMNVFPGIF